jgi:DNA-binding transcriptional ArsR family regulator
MNESRTEQRLPAHLAARIPAELRGALEHPYRRQILRALDRDVLQLSPSELAEAGLIPCSTSCVSYHLRTLYDAGLIQKDRSESIRGTTTDYFSSSIGAQAGVLDVLRSTERSDNQLLAPATN